MLIRAARQYENRRVVQPVDHRIVQYPIRFEFGHVHVASSDTGFTNQHARQEDKLLPTGVRWCVAVVRRIVQVASKVRAPAVPACRVILADKALARDIFD